MQLAEFEKALRLGLGRATVYLQHHDDAPYRDAILHACLHDLSFDDDFEAKRGLYLYRLLQHTRAIEFYRTRILEALAASEDEDAASQLFDLARLFARAGDAEARQVMYDRFQANTLRGVLIGGRAIIELNKAAGLVAVAAAIGGQPRDEEDEWYDDWLLGTAEDEGVENTWRLLQEAAKEQPRIHDFLAKVKAYRARHGTRDRSRRDPATMSYTEIKERITASDPGPPMVSLPLWGETASDEDLRSAALDLLGETKPSRLRSYLRIFDRRRFPLEPDRLIELVSHTKQPVAFTALVALSNIRHPNVRALALHLLATPSKQAAQAVSLLVENFAPGDHARVEALASQPLEPESFHQLGVEIMELFEAHPNPDSEERLLLRLYENDPCSQCRGMFVMRLAALNRLPDWMAEEVRFDADPGLYAELEQYRSTHNHTKALP
jgi:hypothetical protein